MRWIALALSLLLPAAAQADQPDDLAATVFAASSLTDAMQGIAGLYAKAGHAAPKLSFGASSTLARQVDQGAPANLFVSADERWMDWMQKRGLLVPGTRRDLLSNALVLIVPADRAHAGTPPAEIGPNLDLDALLGPGGRLTTGDPANVPVGIYAEQALRKLGLWDKVASRLAPAGNVRAALLLVERGEAAAGIVYATDAAASRGVVVVGTFPASSHDPITYPVALVRGGDTPEAKAFLAFLEGAEARAVFEHLGFGAE